MNKILKAMLEVQTGITNPEKTKSGHKYMYTGLPQLMLMVRPILNAHGLLIVQSSDDTADTIGVVTTIYHAESGEHLTSTTRAPRADLPAQNQYQAHGSAFTYLRKYAVEALLGIASTDTPDADEVATTPSVTLEAVLVSIASATGSDGLLRSAHMASTLRSSDDKAAARQAYIERKALIDGSATGSV